MCINIIPTAPWRNEEQHPTIVCRILKWNFHCAIYNIYQNGAVWKRTSSSDRPYWPCPGAFSSPPVPPRKNIHVLPKNVSPSPVWRPKDRFPGQSPSGIQVQRTPAVGKLTGLGNTRKLFKMESFRGPQRTWFHFVHSTIKFENRKNKKSLDERNGESDRSGDRSSIFIVNKTRISVQLQLNLLHKGVVSLDTWIWQIMVLTNITW
jgi:hypothetical protein